LITVDRAAAAAAGVAVAVAASVAATPAGACACGIALDAEVSSERALVIEEAGREEIVLSLDLVSEGDERAAVVLPVPTDPEVEAIAGGDPLSYLEAATAPLPAALGGDDDAAAAPEVDVIGREVVGGYDVSRIAAGDPGALAQWLDENGYELPPGAEPILGDYVAAGWRFVAIRLAPNSDGRLKPLRVGFATDEPVYPMRLAQLATEPLSLTIWSLADGEREVDGLETTWSGPVSELDPQPPAALADVFAQGSHVTRMEVDAADPAIFTADLELEVPETDDEADEDDDFPDEDFDTAEAQDEDEDADDDLSIVAIALIGVAAASVLAAAVAFRGRD
jgi:hypothetical protein